MAEPTIEVLKDLPEACDTLAAAFSVERAVREVLGMGPQHLAALYRMWVPLLLENPASALFGIRDEQGLASVAVCQGPGRELPWWREAIRGLPMLRRLGWQRCRLLMRFSSDFRQHSPLRPGHLRLAILGTRPEAWRRGYGSALLGRVDQHALACDLTRVYLEADSDGDPKRLYERHGYKTLDQFSSFAGPIDIMVKTL
jgi:GNAT superfamily N-acetyltransferase